MTAYQLTVNFTSDESVTTWDIDGAETAVEFFKIAMDDVDRVTSFRLERLDERGKPVAIPECETVAELSVEDQAEILEREEEQ
jgi:hypothetical protein